MPFTPDLSKGNTIKTFGNSMAPIFVNNDILYYKRVAFRNIKTNDIVIVAKNHQYFTHRVIYTSEKYIVTKGDNNIHTDGKIYPRQVVGRVYRIKRKSDYFAPKDLYRTQSLFYFNEINGITKKLSSQDIPFLFLKGLPLYLYYTNNNPQRLYADCDILVRPDDFSKTKKILEKAGYFHIETTPIKFSRKGIRPEYAFYKKIHGFPVIFDVHTEPVFLMAKVPTENLYPRTNIDAMTEEYLNECRTINLDCHTYPLLSPIHLIIYLTLHFFHHNYRGAYRLSLLHLVIHEELKGKKQKEIDALWDGINSHIKRFDLQNIVYPCFIFLRNYYHTAIPDRILDEITPKGYAGVYIKKQVLAIDPFSDQTTVESGIERFMSVFILTSSPIYKKVLSFFNIQVLTLIFDVMKGKAIKTLQRFRAQL